MFYGSSRSPSSYGEGRYSSYSKGLSYNYSTDLSSSLPPRNPSVQRVLNSDYGRYERSRSPISDYSSSASRLTSLRSLPSSLATDTSTPVRQRDILDDSRASPVSFINDDVGYSPKSRSYFDYSSATAGRYTSYTPKAIKKPQRTDYSDYLRPVLSARPMLKTGYVPRSRAERDEDDSNPIVRERKLIKFKESSSDILAKIRRKISWDLPEEISSPLIDEMKEMYSDKTDEKCMLDIPRSREGSAQRRSSKEITYTSGSSPLSGSPRHSISRRSSGDHSLDRLSEMPLIRKNSPRTNCLVSSRENVYDTSDFKTEDLATGAQAKAPVPPPRKRSIGSVHNIKRTRKSSIETLLSEEKTSNFSKIANEIRRSRETALHSKSLADELENDTRRPSQSDDISSTTANFTENADARKQSNASELSSINEVGETTEGSRRRRRRETIAEPTSDEKVPETRTRCRSRFRSQISNETSNSASTDTNHLSEKPFEDETPHSMSQMHRKSVKYKSDNSSLRSMSKSSDATPEPSVPKVPVQKSSVPSLPVDTKEKTLIQEKSNSLEKKNKYLNAVTSKDKVPVTPKPKLTSQIETIKDKANIVSEKEDPKSKFYRRQLSSEIISRDKENEVSEKVDKKLKTETASCDTGKKFGKIEGKNLDTKNSVSNSSSRLEANEVGVKDSLNKKPVIETKKLEAKNLSKDIIAKNETQQITGKLLLDKKLSTAETKNFAIDRTKIEAKEVDAKGLDKNLKTETDKSNKSLGDRSKIETGEKEVKTLLGTKSTEIKTKPSDRNFSDSSKTETKEKDARKFLDKKLTETKALDVKASVTGTTKTETKIKDEKTSVDKKSVELESKNLGVKNSSVIASKLELKPPSKDKISSELESKKSDAKSPFNDISKVEAKEKDAKPLIDRESELESKQSHVKNSSSDISKTENIDAKTSIDKKSTELDSKRPYLKNSCDISKTENIDAKTSIDKKSTELDFKRPYVKHSCDISKVEVEEVKTLLDSKSTESEVKNSDMTKIPSNVSKVDMKRKDAKPLLEKKANELESKTSSAKIISDNSKQESEKKDASSLLQKKLIGSKISEEKSSESTLSKAENKDDLKFSDKKFNVTAKKLDDKNSSYDINAKVEAKENKSFADTTGKIEHKNFEVGSILDDKARKAETKEISKDLVVGKKFDNLTEKSQNENTRPLGKTQDNFTRNKEEEIVVVCKLPHPKKLEPVSAKKSIPVEQKVIVSIKNSALKSVDVTESSDDSVKNVAPKVQAIIPDAQSILDSKSEKCDKVSETPEINVTHTIVLKPKVQSELPFSNIQKVEKPDGKHLKSIPDVIKSTIRTDTKIGDDVSDIVKSTLAKEDDQLKTKKSLPNFKDNLLEKDNVDSLGGLKTSASDGKLASNRLLTAQGKDKADYQMKQKDNDNSSSVINETSIAKDREKINIKKSSSAVFGTTSKDAIYDKSSAKPDLIQMTTEVAKTKSEKILPLVAEDSTDAIYQSKERNLPNIPQEKSPLEGDKCLTNDINILQPTSKFNEESKKKYDLNISKEKITDSISSGSSDVKSKDIAQRYENDKRKSAIETKFESKSPEVKLSDIPKVKTESEKVQFDRKGQSPSTVAMTKVDTASDKVILKTESTDRLNYKQATDDINAVENKTISTGPEFGINKTILPDNKSDAKKDADNLKKNKVNLNFNENDLKKSKGVTSAYKKSMTLPNVTVLLEEPISSFKENECSLPNIQKNKKTDSVSLSSDNVPAVLQVGKPLVPNKDADKQNLKTLPDSVVNSRLKTQSFEKIVSEEKSSDSNNYETHKKQEKPLQLPHINSSQEKDVRRQDFTTLKDSKVTDSDSSQNDKNFISDKFGKAKVESKEIPVQRKSLKKEEKTESDNKLCSDMKNGEKSKSTGDTFVFEESKDLSKFKLKTETNAFIKDDSTQNSKDISTSVRKSDIAVDNIMPKISENKRNDESGQGKQKPPENVKLPSVYDTKSTDLTKICQQETKDSKENRNAESDKSRITRVGSSSNKIPSLQSGVEKVALENEQSKISQIISKSEQKEKVPLENGHSKISQVIGKSEQKENVPLENGQSEISQVIGKSEQKEKVPLENGQSKISQIIGKSEQKEKIPLENGQSKISQIISKSVQKEKFPLENGQSNISPIIGKSEQKENVPLENGQSKISQIIGKSEQKEKVLSSECEKPKTQIISVEDSKSKAKIASKNDRSELKTNYSEPQKQSLDGIKVTDESQPEKPRKLREVKLPPIPRSRRLGLFLRPKEEPSVIYYESTSDDESETETESESSDEDDDDEEEEEDEKEKEIEKEVAAPTVKETSNLPNGKSPERDEKNRARSETSNASIYSNLSNSTTCTTFSTSSLDDDTESPIRTHTEKLKFRKYEIDDFVFLKLLGKGSFGKVLLAELKDKEMYFAIKCLKKDVVLEDDDVESTMIERRVLALGTQHPYMCKLYCTFQTKSYLFFVMEYLNGGDLMFHIQESRRFEEKRAMFYGAEIVSALKFLHKRGIVYRDIKLDNVMLDEQGHVRLVDFGMCQCRIYREECMPCNFCGTPSYIAPEIVLGQKYNQSVDWWSFGVLLYEMLTGRSPFHGTDEDELFWSICNEEPHYPRYLSKEAIDILGLLLTKAPSKRIGMSLCPAGDIKDHAFFSTINWDKLEMKQVPPPFKPSVSSPSDTRNFDSSFTMDSATLSPVDTAVLESMDQVQFHGFSYTNPHITG